LSTGNCWVSKCPNLIVIPKMHQSKGGRGASRALSSALAGGEVRDLVSDCWSHPSSPPPLQRKKPQKFHDSQSLDSAPSIQIVSKHMQNTVPSGGSWCLYALPGNSFSCSQESVDIKCFRGSGHLVLTH
jgi:hypothetical protein